MLGTAGSTKNPCKILKLWSKVRNAFNLVHYIKCQYSVAMQEAACSLKKKNGLVCNASHSDSAIIAYFPYNQVV